jgi:hypothetical protein
MGIPSVVDFRTLCHTLATVMSHARDRYVNCTRENHRGNPHLEPRYYLDYLYLQHGFEQVRSADGRRNGAFAQ